MYLQARRLSNQQCMTCARWVTYSITTHHTSRQTIINLFRTNPTNQDNLSASINTWKKKGYIELTTKILKIVPRVSTRHWTRRARRLTTLTKASKKWLEILLELKRFAQNAVFFPFQNTATQALKGRLRKSNTSYVSSSYSARLANPYCWVKSDYTIVRIRPSILRVDVRNRVYHARPSPLSSGLRPRRDRLSWHKLWGNTY